MNNSQELTTKIKCYLEGFYRHKVEDVCHSFIVKRLRETYK